MHDVEDIGSEDLFDVSEFPPLDPDEDIGEGRVYGSTNQPRTRWPPQSRWRDRRTAGSITESCDEHRDLWLPGRHDRAGHT